MRQLNGQFHNQICNVAMNECILGMFLQFIIKHFITNDRPKSMAFKIITDITINNKKNYEHHRYHSRTSTNSSECKLSFLSRP